MSLRRSVQSEGKAKASTALAEWSLRMGIEFINGKRPGVRLGARRPKPMPLPVTLLAN
jgi:hypothetical protein